MPWSLATFLRNYSWQSDRDGGIRIRADRMDGEFDNFKAGMEQLLLRSGANSPTGDIDWGGHKITNVAGGGAPGDVATIGQIAGLIGTAARAAARRTAPVAVTPAGLLIPWNVMEFDEASSFDAFGKFVCHSSGYFWVNSTVEFETSGTSNRGVVELDLVQTPAPSYGPGMTFLQNLSFIYPGATQMISVSGLFKCNLADTIHAFITPTIDVGIGISIHAGPNSRMEVYRLPGP
ncbi:MAG TPA: hypothetical protein VNS88_08945 [Nitrospiraceae bacterium]|nr:hypothetical protein [Nitrospiraceae bacterium]